MGPGVEIVERPRSSLFPLAQGCVEGEWGPFLVLFFGLSSGFLAVLIYIWFPAS